MRFRRPGSLVLALALTVATACGARLSEDQREIGIAAGADAGVGASSGEGAATEGDLSSLDGGGRPGAGPASGGSGGSPAGGGPSGEGVPAGGNGGATDIGVTGNQITIATIANISGVQPGLFKSVHQAIQAFAAFVNSEGGIYGRQLKPLLLDDQTNSGGNRAATIEACEKSFALVGSMSAFDDGGVQPGEKCRIPDLTAIPTAPSRALADNIYAAYPNRPDHYIIGPARYIKREYPEIAKKAAMLWLNAAVTRTTAARRMKAYEAEGFEFVVKREVQVLEANYGPYVLEMRNAGVEYVSMVADFQSISRLLKAMRQQNWFPTVRDWDSVAYDPDFLDHAGPAGEGSMIYLNTALFEEGSSNREMQLYLHWLDRVAPGAEPDYFGLYAWSAGRLFAQAAAAAGPRLTRAALIDELEKIHSWNGRGLHAAHDIGNQMPAPCYMYVKVQRGRFARVTPSQGWSCGDGLRSLD
jgi:ABC-type branched-subunit amino acid transport system substrate-binding protein